ncbi:leucine-rich repeat-containing protein 19-like [Megalops cyprinoides]|uniref:leucine-rich repeat-containing protein 19-like n=1 Tax=Megalops cyprinoides TaxID=118141 RepID=UPI0018654D4F|nr:leucine-rich repeat-containing protein 19-like [Megalops cyprinoides]
MGSLGLILGVVMCLWGLAAGSVPQIVGPCVISAREPSFNCSQRKLTKIPVEIWPNVTVLDLSQNPLNLSRAETLRDLRRFSHLALLNLSGSYLPLLETDGLSNLPLLRVLDLSRCQLEAVKSDAFRNLPKLETLLLGNNRLRDPLSSALRDLTSLSFLDLRGNVQLKDAPPAWLKGVRTVLWPGGRHSLVPSEGVTSFHRKLLMEEESTTAGNNRFLYCCKVAILPSLSTPDGSLRGVNSSEGGPSHSWQYLVVALVAALSVSALIVLAVKCKLFHRYLASYRHSLLFEGDASSQCSRTGLAVSFPQHSLDGRATGDTRPSELEDDDGFIEDNYIQASERERAEREAEDLGQDSDDDDDIQFTIG